MQNRDQNSSCACGGHGSRGRGSRQARGGDRLTMEMELGNGTSDTCTASPSIGRRLNGFLGQSLNDRTIQFLVILLDKTVSVR